MKSLQLAIDVGNSQTSLGLFDAGKIRRRWRLATHIAHSTDELRFAVNDCLREMNLSIADIERIGVSSVVPVLSRAYSQLIDNGGGNNLTTISKDLVKTLRIAYRPPEAVGADRLCDAVAGFKKYGAPLIIIDLGTATVFDVILEGGIYQGGVIAPGISTAAESLHRRTAMLPWVEIEEPKSIVGETTTESIQSGIVYGAIEMIDGIVRRIQESLPNKAKVIATGGFASLLFGKSKSIEHVEPDLVLEGIYILMNPS